MLWIPSHHSSNYRIPLVVALSLSLLQHLLQPALYQTECIYTNKYTCFPYNMHLFILKCLLNDFYVGGSVQNQ